MTITGLEVIVMADYRNLKAWAVGMELAEAIYRTTEGFPAAERFGLVGQMRRASVSVPSNIAEGWGRRSRAEYVHHLSMARGSLLELETQLELARRLGLVDDADRTRLAALTGTTGRLLTALIGSLTR
jgi:four helix bundle protein